MTNTMRKVLAVTVVGWCAVVAAFGFTYALCARFGVGASPAVLAAALSMGLVRRPEPLTVRSAAFNIIALPVVALAAGLVGWTLLHVPPLGAAIFCCGVALSVWLRRFGQNAAAAGRAIALPFIALLVVPVHFDTPSERALAPLLILAAGVIAFACSALASWCAMRLHAEPQSAAAEAPRAPREGTMPVATRMALQMLVALVLAFAIGLPLFGEHWPWIVLTAFIVCSGALGRADAVYKAVLRFGGALAGTIAAALVAQIAFPNAQWYAAATFCVLFVGMWLRQVNYAYWAACATLIFALLQGTHGAGAASVFILRLVCIVIGALCALAATWFVYPIRTEQIVRRRVADALGALRDMLAGSPEEHEARIAALEHHATQLQRLAPPVRLHRSVFRPRNEDHPATLIEQTFALIAHARMPNFDRAHVGAELRRLGALLRSK